jgi:hypothetical protein
METDEQKIFYALSMWANHIETGDIVLGAEDAIERGIKTKPLNEDQMRSVLRLRELSRMALQGDIKIGEAQPQDPLDRLIGRRQAARDARAETTDQSARITELTEALEANQVFHTPIAKRRKPGGEWDEYESEAITMTLTALGKI